MQLREYDKELEDFEGRLFEFPINFIPSYPFQEDVNEATSYMQTRVPAWCDRVLLSPTAKMLVQNVCDINFICLTELFAVEGYSWQGVFIVSCLSYCIAQIFLYVYEV